MVRSSAVVVYNMHWYWAGAGESVPARYSVGPGESFPACVQQVARKASQLSIWKGLRKMTQLCYQADKQAVHPARNPSMENQGPRERGNKVEVQFRLGARQWFCETVARKSGK